MSLQRRLLRRANHFWLWAVTAPAGLALAFMGCGPSAYLWCWALGAPTAVVAALWWPALLVCAANLLMAIWGIAMRYVLPKWCVKEGLDGSLWPPITRVAAAACHLAGVLGERPDLGYVASFALTVVAGAPRVWATRDVSVTPVWLVRTTWIGLLFAGFGWAALGVYLLEWVISGFVRRDAIWAIRNLPLYEDALVQAKQSLARERGYDRFRPLNQLREMEEWQALADAQETVDRDARGWFSPAYKAEIQLGLGRPQRARAILENEKSEFGEHERLEAEAYLQMGDEAAAEEVLRRPPKRHPMDLWRTRSDVRALSAWGLLYRHRGDDLRALYYFEQPFGGPTVRRSQSLAVEVLLKLGLPGEAAAILEKMLGFSKWARPEEVVLLADCYRKSGRASRAERLLEALSVKRVASNALKELNE